MKYDDTVRWSDSLYNIIIELSCITEHRSVVCKLLTMRLFTEVVVLFMVGIIIIIRIIIIHTYLHTFLYRHKAVTSEAVKTTEPYVQDH